MDESDHLVSYTQRVGSDARAIADGCTGLHSAARRAGSEDAAHESVALMAAKRRTRQKKVDETLPSPW